MDIENKKRLELTNCLCARMRQSSRNMSQIYNKHLKASGEKINAKIIESCPYDPNFDIIRS